MKTIDAAHEVLHQIPSRVDDGGLKNPGATAYYTDVPFSALPPGCSMKRTATGFVISGTIGDLQYRGHASESQDQKVFRRVMLSFVQRPDPASLLH